MYAKAANIASFLQQNRGVPISEPPMVLESTLQTNEAITNPTSNSVGSRKANGPKTVLFNGIGQPVGANAAPLAHFLSKAAKGLVPLTVPSWYGDWLSEDQKKLIWNHVKKYYAIDDCHRKFCFKKMAKYWRGYRSEMIKKFTKGVKTASVEVVARNTRPANVQSIDTWTKFVKLCLSPSQVARRKFYQEIRQAQNLQYHSSKKSLACIEYDMKQRSEDPDAITRVDVWLAGFSKKKKASDEEVVEQEVVRKVNETLAQQPDSPHWTIYDDPITQVLGPERRGRVRGYGFGETPSLLTGRGLANSRNHFLEKEVQDLKRLVTNLIAQVAQLDKGDNSSQCQLEEIHISMPEEEG